MEEREKLEHLLPHWIEHNEEHAAEFRQWAEKARQSGLAGIPDEMNEAAGQLQKSSDFLRRALEKLAGSRREETDVSG